jgi:hypothetical protein
VEQQSQSGGFQRKENRGEEFNSSGNISESGQDPLDQCGVLNMEISIETDHMTLFD